MQDIKKLHSVPGRGILGWIGRESAILTRLILIVLLSAVLMEAFRWAMDVTQANEKRISTNIAHLQKGTEATRSTPEKRVVPLRAGPIIEALKERSSHRR